MKSCEEITYLIEQSHFENLSFKERASLRFHKMLCVVCKNYSKESKALHKIILEQNKHAEVLKLSTTEKERIRKTISGL